MTDVILIGSGGHARVLIEAIGSGTALRIVGAVDIEERVGLVIDGVEVLGTDADLPRLREEGVSAAVLGIGSVGDPSIRRSFGERLRALGFDLPAVVHATAHVASNARLGEGSFVGAAAVIGAGATVGEFAIINTGAIVDHECEIGDYVHLAPGCTLSGGVKVGEDAHLGTGASVIQCLSIGAGTTVGAGSVVVEDLPQDVVAYGNPCRVARVKR